ncbi:MAG: V-type sodium ATPase subunit D [Eubacteriales bacterium SKADARSKE-1]|nr:V-type sodium ATPase subunit D [Eubacteriales bacterium SKADARSKE-1]
MANIMITPTRMELTRLKKKLVTARRGHKLLKDKRDEMMRQFLTLIEENKALRKKVETAIIFANQGFSLAKAETRSEFLNVSLMVPKQEVSLDVYYKNIMSVNVPKFKVKTRTHEPGDIYPYSFATTSSFLDDSIKSLFNILPDMLHLAECEKACWLLADEIEKTNRRVNALEYTVIPDTLQLIKYITMKIDENERSTAVRLMKVKEMLLTTN